MPKVQAERSGLIGDRHRELVESLETLFLEEGFRHVTVDELAARMKCSKRTLYELAPSKQELFLVVVEQWLDRIRRLGWAGALEHDDPEKRIFAYLEPGVTESRAASRRFLEDLRSYRPALAVLEAHQRERTSILRDIVKDGIRRGRFRDLHPALVAEVVQAAVSRFNEPDFLEEAGVSFSGGFSELYNLLLHGLFAAPSPISEAKPR